MGRIGQNTAIPPCTHALRGGTALSAAVASVSVSSLMMRDNAYYWGFDYVCHWLAEAAFMIVGVALIVAYIYLCGRAVLSAANHTRRGRTLGYAAKAFVAFMVIKPLGLGTYVSGLLTANDLSTVHTFGSLVQFAWMLVASAILTAFCIGLATSLIQTGYSLFVAKPLALH